jgi:hypothetical protein
MNHTVTLVIAYTVICALWWGLGYVLPLWRQVERPTFPRPWAEAGLALVAVIFVLILGQLWSRGVRLSAPGAWHIVAESVNQLLIFSPVVLLPLIRKQTLASAWIERRRLWARLATGLGLALIALSVFHCLEGRGLSYWQTVTAVFWPGHAHLAVQVLLEDVAVAIVFVRAAAALGVRWAILLVAALFAVGHLPALLATGASAAEIIGLIRDFGLGVLVIGTLWRAADIAWFWPVHFALDMTQFLSHGHRFSAVADLVSR